MGQAGVCPCPHPLLSADHTLCSKRELSCCGGEERNCPRISLPKNPRPMLNLHFLLVRKTSAFCQKARKRPSIILMHNAKITTPCTFYRTMDTWMCSWARMLPRIIFHSFSRNWTDSIEKEYQFDGRTQVYDRSEAIKKTGRALCLG